MQLNNFSQPATSNHTQFLVPGASSRQSDASLFEAAVSLYSPQDKSEDPSTPADLRQSKLQMAQDSTDELPEHLKATIKALDKAFEQEKASEQEKVSEQDESPNSPAEESAPAAPPPPPDVPAEPVPSSRITWNGGTLTDAELQIVAVLNRHKDQCPLSWDSLADKANDPSTPPDLKEAINKLRQDPELFYAIGSQGDGRCGGKIKAKDLSEFSASHSQVANFQEQQAHSYEQNYIPSDGTGNGQPSVMTLNDALRELYRYSDHLPKSLSLDDFKQIVDGKAKTGKCPAQVIAAAQYFLDHADAWKGLYGGAIDKVRKEDFLQVASSSMNLTQSELDTLGTISKNQSAFFGNGDLTRDKLARMAEDESLDPSVRQAASQLLSDPLLFGLLNNSITGYKTHHKFLDFGGGHTVDSGNISNKDFTHFYGNMSAANRTVQQVKTHAPTTDADQAAVADMMIGVADQPDIKSAKKNGGALMHVVDDVLKVGSKVLDVAATAVGLLGFIPVLGEVADAISMGLELESQAANILHTAITGGNIKKALAEAGINIAAQALGCISGPEVKLAIREGLAKTVLEEAATRGIDMTISEAQSYADNYLNDLKERLETEPTQVADVPSKDATTPSSQNVV
ncbi:HrpF/NolX family T3SS translocon protein [Bradyrhizobium arachidis]|uniref:HrpF/NolX family T3SS translocon protein n=1 Tax=Bradyrhizobium arachidis TaxID=858423 RepID=UPI0021614E52|nr:HrpF/NolX family T3SS translocon protein [Bradyrhizobium arachidis]UVO30276.1 nodulation protein NOLX [Bradyrhizobium arachidis]